MKPDIPFHPRYSNLSRALLHTLNAIQVLSALLLVAALSSACTDGLPSTGTTNADDEAQSFLVGKPVQIGSLALSVEAQSQPNATRANTAAADCTFPQQGTTMTVFLTASDGNSYVQQRANYTCTAVETDENQHVVSATWTADETPLCWLRAGTQHIFSAISPAISLTPITHNTDGTEMAIPAATFNLPDSYTQETLNYWGNLRSTVKGISTLPTTDVIKLEMQHALTRITLLDIGYTNIMLTDIPQTAFVNPLTGEITAMRSSIIQSSSPENGPSYTLDGDITGSKNVYPYTSAKAGWAYQAFAIPTSYYSNATAKHDGSASFQCRTSNSVYNVNIGSGTDNNGKLTGGGFCPGSKLEVGIALGQDITNILYSNGSYWEGKEIGSRLNLMCDNNEKFDILFILGPLHPEWQAEIMRGASRMQPDFLYIEQLKEVKDGQFKGRNGVFFILPQVTDIGKEAFAREIESNSDRAIITPLLQTIGKDAFKGHRVDYFYLRGTDENGEFFIPTYNYSEGENRISKALVLIGLPEEYFNNLPENPEMDNPTESTRRAQLQQCIELIGTENQDQISTGALYSITGF